MFKRVEHKDRFRGAIHPTSILWQLKQEEYARKRAKLREERGELFDLPRWTGLRGELTEAG